MAHQSWFRSFSGWLLCNKAQLLQFGGPFLLFEAFNWAFDKGFFPFALWFWGPVWGAIIPSALALVVNALVFWAYDFMKVDWLKAHALRELADKENKSKFEELLTWHLTPRTSIASRILAEFRFALMLVPVDPVIVAIYYRENHFQGVSGRDWLMLVKATIFACVVWLLIMEPLVLGLKALWRLFF